MIPDGYKECHTCNEIKPIIEFYNSAYKNPLRNCKVCYKKYHRDKVAQQMEDKGGSDAYYSEPDKYTSTIQKVQTFMVMELCGWTYTDGVWWKKGIKTVDKVWECFKETPKVIRKKQSNAGRKIKKGVWNSVDKIVKLVEEGYTYDDISDIFDCSHTLIRTVVTKYRNEKRAS